VKKIFALILILSHLFSTVGFSMEVHECDGEKSYSLYGFSLNSFCKCNHESRHHSEGCCKDKKTIVKAEKNDKQIVKVFVAKHIIQDFEICTPLEFVNKNTIVNGHNSFDFGTKHPPDHSPPLYILYNVFLI
jgi:hypothetical protein